MDIDIEDSSLTTDSSYKDSLPTTSDSTEVISYYERFKLQREPWVCFLRKNKTCFIVSGVLLLSEIFFIICRIVFYYISNKEALSAFAGFCGTLVFFVQWSFIPEYPPYFASRIGIPLYRRRKNGDDLERYIQE